MLTKGNLMLAKICLVIDEICLNYDRWVSGLYSPEQSEAQGSVCEVQVRRNCSVKSTHLHLTNSFLCSGL